MRTTTFGVLLFVFCMVLIGVYTYLVFLADLTIEQRYWVLAVPVYLVVVVFLGLVAWVGWNMFRTLPSRELKQQTVEE
ncbi:hypothetical protein DRN94_000805 [archaeon]|nr:hypothetical protein [archaeon]